MTTYILIVMIPGSEPSRVNCRNTSETVAAICEKQQNTQGEPQPPTTGVAYRKNV